MCIIFFSLLLASIQELSIFLKVCFSELFLLKLIFVLKYEAHRLFTIVCELIIVLYTILDLTLENLSVFKRLLDLKHRLTIRTFLMHLFNIFRSRAFSEVLF